MYFVFLCVCLSVCVWPSVRMLRMRLPVCLPACLCLRMRRCVRVLRADVGRSPQINDGPPPVPFNWPMLLLNRNADTAGPIPGP